MSQVRRKSDSDPSHDEELDRLRFVWWALDQMERMASAVSGRRARAFLIMRERQMKKHIEAVAKYFKAVDGKDGG